MCWDSREKDSVLLLRQPDKDHKVIVKFTTPGKS